VKLKNKSKKKQVTVTWHVSKEQYARFLAAAKSWGFKKVGAYWKFAIETKLPAEFRELID
jgi:hypothetical protein